MLRAVSRVPRLAQVARPAKQVATRPAQRQLGTGPIQPAQAEPTFLNEAVSKSTRLVWALMR
jgi:hypothetical protein